ncbi:MAG: exodeoxyribonuclease III [Clostridia bacterium]|nr:exodeoxyribonuclease III [Clostridia bacterium]
MKFISWNVNGLRACKQKGFDEFFEGVQADIFAVQESKMQNGQADIDMKDYFMYMSSAEKKGYSGTVVYAKKEPINVFYGIDEKYNDEGRVITLEYEDFYFVNAYVPNAQPELKRIDYREEFEDDMREYLSKLDKTKPVVYCGDLNVARCELDLKNPKANEGNPGYSKQEREKIEKLLESGFEDSFRYFNGEKVKYSWWSYRANARAKNVGWRIDYFIVSNRITEKIMRADILDYVLGSDHAPVVLEIDL